MKKKLVFSLLALMLVVGLVGAGSFAVFSDTEKSEENVFQAGTLELDVEGADEGVTTYSFENIKPGDIGGWDGLHDNPQWITERPQWTVKNTGSLPGELTVTIENIRDYDENDNQIDTADGALSWAIDIWFKGGGSNFWGHLGRGEPALVIDLDPGDEITVQCQWQLGSEPNDGWNVLQGHSTEFDVRFYLEQTEEPTADVSP